LLDFTFLLFQFSCFIYAMPFLAIFYPLFDFISGQNKMLDQFFHNEAILKSIVNQHQSGYIAIMMFPLKASLKLLSASTTVI
jgi:hypothetical protein